MTWEPRPYEIESEQQERIIRAISHSFREVLTAMLVCFTTLKLTGLIAWSWLWVLAPFWVPAVLAAGALAWAILTKKK